MKRYTTGALWTCRLLATLIRLSVFLVALGGSSSNARAAQAASSNPTAKYEPWDRKPLRIYVSGAQAAARYQYRTVFFSMPPGGSKRLTPAGDDEITRGAVRVDPRELPGRSEMRFKHPFEMFASSDNTRFLICTAPASSDYLVLEKAEVEAKKQTRIPWESKDYDFADFCGVVSVAGKVLYEFPFQQRRPNDLLSPISISTDGTYAAVFIGKEHAGQEGRAVGSPREIWTWEAPDTLKKHPGPWKKGEPDDGYKALAEMMRRFRTKPK